MGIPLFDISIYGIPQHFNWLAIAKQIVNQHGRLGNVKCNREYVVVRLPKRSAATHAMIRRDI